MQATMKMQIPAVAAIGVLALLPPLVMAQQEDPFATAYVANCSTCHGQRMEGAAQGTPLLVQVEKLVSGLGRIRDVAVDAQGLILLLLEHASGSRIVRLVPEDNPR